LIIKGLGFSDLLIFTTFINIFMRIQFKYLVFSLCVVFAGCGGGENKKNETKTDEKSTEVAKEGQTSGDDSNANPEQAPEKSDKAVVVAKSGLSMREEPSAKGKLVKLLPTNSIVKVLETGEEVTIKGKKAPWYKIQYGNAEGYAFGGYLQMGSQVKATNDVEAQTAGEETSQTTSLANVQQKGLVTANSGLTLREAPKVSAKSITVIPKNHEVGVLEFMDFIDKIKGIDGVWCKVRYGKKEGYLFSAYINFSTAKIIAKSGLTVRAEPSKQGEKITVIPSGKVVYLLAPDTTPEGDTSIQTVVEDAEGKLWYKIRYGKYEGWAFGEFLEIESGGC
jgi:uncharacterized protein YgiM (DUF1202 family)